MIFEWLRFRIVESSLLQTLTIRAITAFAESSPKYFNCGTKNLNKKLKCALIKITFFFFQRYSWSRRVSRNLINTAYECQSIYWSSGFRTRDDRLLIRAVYQPSHFELLYSYQHRVDKYLTCFNFQNPIEARVVRTLFFHAKMRSRLKIHRSLGLPRTRVWSAQRLPCH